MSHNMNMFITDSLKVTEVINRKNYFILITRKASFKLLKYSGKCKTYNYAFKNKAAFHSH